MTRDDIIRMAREAGFPFNKYGLLTADDEGEIDADAMLERFAALVAAAERERLAVKFMEMHNAQQHSNNYWHFAARKISEET